MCGTSTQPTSRRPHAMRPGFHQNPEGAATSTIAIASESVADDAATSDRHARPSSRNPSANVVAALSPGMHTSMDQWGWELLRPWLAG